MSQNKNPARAAGMIMLLILASRVLGFVRETIMGRLFSRMETDAFFAAFIIPDLMYYLLVGGALSAAFIPIFTEYLSTRNEEEAWEVGSAFISTAIIALIAATALGMLVAPWLPGIIAPGFSGEKLTLLVKLIQVMFPAVCFTSVAGLFMGVLNSYQHFFSPAFGPNIYNLFIIAGAVFLGSTHGVSGMAVGVVLGAMANMVTQILFLRDKRRRFRFRLNWTHPGFRRILALMGPAVIGLSVTQVNLAVNNALASQLAEGSITALRFANRLIQLPLGIFGMAVSTAFFPTMTRQIATGQVAGFKDTFSRGIRFILFITIPSAVGLVVLRQPIVALLFQGGEFTANHTWATAYALTFYSLGLFAHAAILIIPRAFYAMQDTLTPMMVGIGTVIVNIVLNVLFLRFSVLQHGGLALAFSITGFLNMALSLYLLRRKLKGIGGTQMLITVSKSTGAAVFMAAITYGVYRLGDWVFPRFLGTGRMLDLAVVSAGLVAGVAAYLAAASIMAMPEREVLFSMLRHRSKGA